MPATAEARPFRAVSLLVSRSQKLLLEADICSYLLEVKSSRLLIPEEMYNCPLRANDEVVLPRHASFRCRAVGRPLRANLVHDSVTRRTIGSRAGGEAL
jgi:hypothetical protein